MAETFALEIVTPERLVAKDHAEEIQIPGKSGYVGILAGHAPLITELDIGEISFRTTTGSEQLVVAWGFAEILPEKVTILAETAERAEDIDAAKAQQDKKAAEEELQQASAEADTSQTRAKLRLAEVRLKLASAKSAH
jgi:F-type H+-transporting ATPase subunit epsilon